MLVSDETAKRMFNTNGFLYKSFSLLFSNRLWTKPVPKGFPICPYFWMALFSAFFFVPFIHFPIGHILLPILSAVCKTVIGIPDKFICRLIWSKDDDWEPGKGILVGVVGLLGLAFIIIGGISVVLNIHTLFLTLSTIGAVGYICFGTMLTLPFLVGFRFWLNTKSHCCESKHKYYTFTFATVVIVLSLLLAPAQFLGSFVVLGSALLGFLVAVGAAVLGFISWAFGYVWIALCFVGEILSIVGVIIWPVIVSTAIFLCVISVIGALGLLVLKFTTPTKSFSDIVKQPTKPIDRDYSYAWELRLQKFAVEQKFADRIVGSDPFNKLIEDFYHLFETKNSLEYLKEMISRWLIEEYMTEDTLSDEVKKINPQKYKTLYDIYNNNVFRSITSVFSNISRDTRDLFVDDVSDKIQAVLDRVESNVEFRDELVRTYEIKKAAILKSKERDAKIEKICNRLTTFLSPIGVGWRAIISLFVGTWNILKRIFLCCKDISSVGWKLLKKKKSEACPYFMFSDESPSDVPDESEVEPK